MRKRIGLCLLALGLSWLATGATWLRDSQQITVSGTVFYDDNSNGVLDSDEEVAAGARVAPIIKTFGASVPADANGRFTLNFTLSPSQNAYVAGYALRPGYPYSPRSMANYQKNLALPPASDGRIQLNIGLIPYTGVLERLPEGAHQDFPIPNGRFFTQTNSYVGGSALGFAVTNDEGIPFWDTWQRFSLENIGYPLSKRFTWSIFTMQVFQKAIFQWQPGQGLFFINTLDELHNRKLDQWPWGLGLTPPPLDPSFDAGKPWEQIMRDRLALLDINPTIKARYYSAPDPLLLYGLPTSRVEDYGDLFVMRTQRTVFQLWKVNVPFARAGEITLANAGEVVVQHAAIFSGTNPDFPYLYITELPPPGSIPSLTPQ
ncbi:MAG: hypothetical protein HY677_04585 [Chloroflexi bacterium]|nr:hypothetical protein [Chloroflexota bacterium]